MTRLALCVSKRDKDVVGWEVSKHVVFGEDKAEMERRPLSEGNSAVHAPCFRPGDACSLGAAGGELVCNQHARLHICLSSQRRGRADVRPATTYLRDRHPELVGV